MSEIKLITAEEVWKRVPIRPEDSHKGTFGKLLITAGSYRYRGAAALSTEGALRTGCGIVTLASTEPVFAGIQPRLPEAICLPCTADDAGGISADNFDQLKKELDNQYSCLLMGPGMGNTDSTRRLVTRLTQSAGCAVVLDADGLNACAADLPHPVGRPLVITPHPGEMARLTGLSIAQVKADRESLAVEFARQHDCVVVLKEHRTLVAGPDGSLWRNTSGCSGLARGGSGDILAGMIGSFLAQHMDPLDAALCGVWLHGAASERCAAEGSLTAMLPHDIFAALGRMFLEQGR